MYHGTIRSAMSARKWIKKLTGAKYMVMDSDVPFVASGGKKDFFYAHTGTCAR
jgi:metallo-beta-lactamase class B